MMKKLLTAFASCAALAGAQTAAAHGHIDPYITPAAPWVIEGTTTVSKGITLDCDFKLTLTGPEDNPDTGGPGVSHTDVHHLTANLELTGGGGLCSLVTVDPIPAPNVEYSGSSNTGTFTLRNVYAHTITLGDCTGDINVAWNNGNVTFNQTLPAATAGSPCTLAGAGILTSPAGGQVKP
ncbi:hypothetical protein EAO27_10875 [Sphingopyxis sp. YF1]|uniref:hypothetical protein n=1 Tax=Sphingopyxis sp. YF1 TaxID=2482763 RepID=UPI001F61F4B3|nr:hypothetical protein [Sphingopyxis sp. YF1]UNU43156.1 hypothetical protein EAO27_10875 [Sphingopyxis sp. YF1]